MTAIEQYIITRYHMLTTDEKQQMEQTHLIKVNAKDEIIRLKDDEIARVKDMKQKMSGKEIGEK